MLNRQIVIVAVVGLLSSAIHADTIYVDAANCPGPGDGSEGDPFCNIQPAIITAMDTDVVVVAPGTYFGSLNLLGKAITLRSSDGPEVTIIDGTGFFHVVRCVNDEGPDTVIDGFTITGGNADGSFPDDLGGGMYNASSSPTVTNCTFSGNSADGSGGGMSNANSNPTVTNCTFASNTAEGGGGGMTNVGGSPTVTNCTFSGNHSGNGGGGGMFNVASSPTVTNCTFSENSASSGGGMFNGGSNPTVTNCTFSGNEANVQGGGMFNTGSSPTVTNCTFSENTANFFGGGMSNSGSSPTVTNCILWGDSPDEIFVFSGDDPNVTFSNVEGGWPGIGNINADPTFADPDNGDVRLQAASPCIDAADNTAVPAGIDTDLDGNPRFLEIPETPDTGNGTLPIVDMGAYESLGGGCLAVINQEVVCHADGTTFTVNIEGLNACTGGTTQVTFTASGGAVGEELCFTTLVNDGGFCCSTEICVTIPDCAPAGQPSDLDGDGIVGIVDWLALLADWGSCSDCGTPQACPADFDGDCAVGIGDLLILLGNWTA